MEPSVSGGGEGLKFRTALIPCSSSSAVARPHQPTETVVVRCPPLREGGGPRHEEDLVAALRDTGCTYRRPCNGSGLASHGPSLRASTSPGGLQLVDRLLLGRQSGWRLVASGVYARQYRCPRTLYIHATRSH